jgi:hypothetical protein
MSLRPAANHKDAIAAVRGSAGRGGDHRFGRGRHLQGAIAPHPVLKGTVMNMQTPGFGHNGGSAMTLDAVSAFNFVVAQAYQIVSGCLAPPPGTTFSLGSHSGAPCVALEAQCDR